MPNTCTVTGSLLTPDGTGLSGVTVTATMVQPFIYPGSTSLIMNYTTSTTTDNTGAWTLTLVETATAQLTISITLDYPTGAGDYKRRDYTVTIPNQASANFTDLITGQG